MVYLCFINGRNQNEMVKIIEGEGYEIDRITTNQVNSDAIRKKYKKQFAEFQAKYPHAKNGAVRIYGDGIISENGQRVLYQKHRIAFNHIIKDKRFLRWSCSKDLDGDRRSRLIYDTYILKGVVNYGKELQRINQYISSIKKEDRKESGLTGGGRRFYIFLRQLLNRYEEYREKYHKPSIDDIWQRHLETLERAKLEREQSAKVIILDDTSIADFEDSEPEIDEDYYRLGEEAVFQEPLYEFFRGDTFERYYDGMFVDDELLIINCLNRTNDESKTKALIEATDACYTGIVRSASLPNFKVRDAESLNNASIIIIYTEEEDIIIRRILIQALENKADVILISDSPQVLEQYSRRFKSVIPMYDSDEQHIEIRKQLAEYFKEQYISGKGYKKQ